MIRRITPAASAAIVGALLVACSSTVSHTAHVGAATTSPAAQGYDVAAARLCKAFDTFVNDAQKGANVADSTALEDALKKVEANYGPGRRWQGLAADVATFINYAAAGSGNLKAEGLKIGRDCLEIPQAAQKAAGL